MNGNTVIPGLRFIDPQVAFARFRACTGCDGVEYDTETNEVWQYIGTCPGKDVGAFPGEDGEVHQFRHRHHPSTGKRMIVNVRAIPLEDDGGPTPEGIVCP